MAVEQTEGPEVLVEKRGRVGYLTLNRPERLNALSVAMMGQIREGLAEFDVDDDVAVVVMRGKGRAFCSGMDIREVAEQHLDVTAHKDRWETDKLGLWFHHTFWEYRKPVILQLQGYCYAGACYFLGVTDLVVAADDALIGAPEGKAFGLEPSLGGWPLSIGARWTKALLFTGDAIDGTTAERIGMINKAVPEAELEEYTDWLAARIAKSDTALLALHKQTANNVFDILGAYAILKAGMTFDHMEHREGTFYELLRRVKEDGVTSALEWVYEPFGGMQVKGMPTFLDGPRAEEKWEASRTTES
jgi:enoyl-CoA hydratase